MFKIPCNVVAVDGVVVVVTVMLGCPFGRLFVSRSRSRSLGATLGLFGNQFGVIWESRWGNFGAILGLFWCHVGVIMFILVP